MEECFEEMETDTDVEVPPVEEGQPEPPKPRRPKRKTPPPQNAAPDDDE